jgi:hypothetical protein
MLHALVGLILSWSKFEKNEWRQIFENRGNTGCNNLVIFHQAVNLRCIIAFLGKKEMYSRR